MSAGGAGRDIYDETIDAIVAASDDGEPLTTPEVAEALDRDRRAVYERLRTLADRGALETKKVGSGARVWWLPPHRLATADETTADPVGDGTDHSVIGEETRFRTLAEGFPNGVVTLYDRELRFRLVGGRVFEQYPLDAADMRGRTPSEVFDGELARRLTATCRAALEGERASADVEYENRHWHVIAAPVTEEGRIVGGIAISQDVTDQRKREFELARYERLIDAVGDPVYELDDEGRFTYVNAAFSDRFGLEVDDLLGEHVSTHMRDDDVARARAEIVSLLADEPGGSATLEFEVQTATGEWTPVENHLTIRIDDEGQFAGSTGVLRDISQRIKREREYRSLVENLPGVVLFCGTDPSWPLEAAYGECRELTGYEPRELVEELSWGEDLIHPDDREWIYEQVTGDLERDGDFEATYRITDRDGELHWVWERGELTDDDRIQAFLSDITDRKRYEQRLERQQERLTVLDNLHAVVRRITEAALEGSSREEIEAAVCSELADSESYAFAWVGEVDSHTDQIVPRTESGVEGYLDEIELSADPANPTGQGPAGRAARTGEMCVSRDVFTDPTFEPWREEAKRYDFRSFAAIPIVHEGTLYGLIGIYSARPDAFGTAERDVVGQLGEIVGHAISSVERKQAMVSDEVVEIGLRIREFLQSLGLSDPIDGTVQFHRMVPIGDGTHLFYGTAEAGMVETVQQLVDRPETPHWESVDVHSSDGGRTRFELKMSDTPVLSTVATHGGYIEEVRLDAGDLEMQIHLSPTADVHQFVDAVADDYPTVELLNRRQRQRPVRTSERIAKAFSEELTERQLAALEAGYYAGFFEWPRNSSGEEVAASLEISPPTFHQHVRKAERKILEVLLEDR